MYVTSDEALQAAHFPLTASALEYYYESIEGNVSTADQVFEMLRERFQTRSVQERALSQWQTIDFASQRSESDHSDHDTLHTLYMKAKKLHRTLPVAYADDLHLRDFLLRACTAEPVCFRIPEEPAKSSSDVHAQLSAAISRYIANRARSSRIWSSFPRRSIGDYGSRTDVHFTEMSPKNGSEAEEVETHSVSKPLSSLQKQRENRLDRSGKQMLCHHCSSKYHLLSSCPTASTESKVHYLSQLEDDEAYS
jgi:hypothetical protein